MERIRQLSLSKPLLISVLLFCLTMIFRLIDIFALRLDELLGEIIISKMLGFIVVVIFVRIIGGRLSDIGFDFNNKFSIFIIGFVFTLALIILGYIGEFIVFSSNSPKLYISAIDPKTGMTGSIGFALFLLFGNVINCFMEEGLFRGIMISLLKEKYSITTTILLQGLLFGIWHIPWAFKWYMSGMVSGSSGFIMALIINFLPMIFMGIVFGVMYYYTNSIWTPWISHFVINSVLNLVHVGFNGELNLGMTIRMAIFQSIIFILIPIIVKLTKKLNKVKLSN